MDNAQLEVIKRALALYGADLDSEDHCIVKKGKTGVKAVVKRSRLRFEMLDGSLLFSGGVTEQAVSTFVEKFWYWTKKA
jgi:hypothetical protein